MPELRKDPVLGRWIIIAQERGKRPTDFIVESVHRKGGFCPLCPGNEKTTPAEVLGYRNDSGQWQLRVVPNKYPALVITGDLDKEGEGIYDKMNGIGAHEVIIETPDHNADFSNLPVEQLVRIFYAYRDRMLDLERDHRFKYVLIFKNFGREAGASLEHPHSQLVALPILPRMIVSELDGSLAHYRHKERCVFCDIIRQEIKEDKRVICSNEYFIVVAPYAPRFPFEMWIVPRYHNSSYQEQDAESFSALARIFSESIRRLNACIPDVSYNFVLHTSPLRSSSLEHYHWHFEIMPKLTTVAGFEWGSGFYINPVSPENAAKYLREVELSTSVVKGEEKRFAAVN
ncbi:MAG: galactose-1-phosphate uridylyltransferase [Desulfurivibrionaceae bacterium]